MSLQIAYIAELSAVLDEQYMDLVENILHTAMEILDSNKRD